MKGKYRFLLLIIKLIEAMKIKSNIIFSNKPIKKKPYQYINHEEMNKNNIFKKI